MNPEIIFRCNIKRKLSELRDGSDTKISFLHSLTLLQSRVHVLLPTHPVTHPSNVNGARNTISTREASSAGNTTNTRGFPKTNHSGSSARIVLEENKINKKVASKRD